MMSELTKALLSVQKKLTNIKIVKDSVAKVRTKKGGEYSYKYTNFGSILKTIRPLLDSHDLLCNQEEDFDVIGGKTFCVVNTMITHISGESKMFKAKIPFETFNNMSVPQSAGSHFTYLRRYATEGIFFISSEDDNDGVGSHYSKNTQQKTSFIENHIDHLANGGADSVSEEGVKKVIFESALSPERKDQIYKDFCKKPVAARQSYFEQFIMAQIRGAK